MNGSMQLEIVLSSVYFKFKLHIDVSSGYGLGSSFPFSKIYSKVYFSVLTHLSPMVPNFALRKDTTCNV